MEFLQIDHLPIQPYSHKENQLVERLIRNILTGVKEKSN